MEKKSLYDYYIGLLPNMILELYFYIPKDEIPIDIFSELKVLQNDKILNKVFVIDTYKGPISYNNETHKGTLIMTTNLEKNIFSLVEKKSKLSKLEFKFLSEKYILFAEALLYFANWMYKNHQKVFGTDKRLNSILFLQLENYKKHYETFVSTFYISKKTVPIGNFKTNYIVDTIFPDLAKSFSKNSISEIIREQQESIDISVKKDYKQVFINKEKIQGDKKTIKKRLVTEEEAEKLLLKVYFNIS